ncbi:MAG: hypothetical protein TH68_05615 [Candidatus Synechococcus spongiarum 142]|uniref:Uncharacterized protein n=1 Tax=Candidatus Synechococcus spongiarum 142 TaxID=1608213 RepID=A0A6N3X870_9SYNE|nr:MAG: hypothetical protein TH68_05615 [Candidatus Synechococcus spongiarum 142]
MMYLLESETRRYILIGQFFNQNVLLGYGRCTKQISPARIPRKTCMYRTGIEREIIRRSKACRYDVDLSYFP